MADSSVIGEVECNTSVTHRQSRGSDESSKANREAPESFQAAAASEWSEREVTSEIFKRNLTRVLSIIYFLFILTVSGAIHIFTRKVNYSTLRIAYATCLVLIGFCWLFFFHWSIHRYRSTIIGRITRNAMRGRIYSTAQLIKEPFRFLAGRQTGSFYLKIGMAAFCFGHLIKEGLDLVRKGVHLHRGESCANVASFVLSFLIIFNALYQLYILFKYSNVAINTHKSLARFGVMHMMAASLTFWMETIVKDFLTDLYNKANDSNVTVEPQELYGQSPFLPNFVNNSFNNPCFQGKFAEVAKSSLSYLYPFTIEYNLVRTGVWFMIWLNIGNVAARPQSFKRYSRTSEGGVRVFYQSNVILHADCHSANKGIFAGIALMTVTFVSIIVFYLCLSQKDYSYACKHIHSFQEALLTSLGLIGIIHVYRRLYVFDYRENPVTFLDNLLLTVPLPFYFVYSILSMVADFNGRDYARLVLNAVIVIEVIIQAMCIMEGLQRCSKSSQLQFQKPGREVLTFLIVCNVMFWMVSSFEYSNVEFMHSAAAYYGEDAWFAISHISFPLMLFFRFHSSVCLSDMWKSIYIKEE